MNHQSLKRFKRYFEKKILVTAFHATHIIKCIKSSTLTLTINLTKLSFFMIVIASCMQWIVQGIFRSYRDHKNKPNMGR